MKVTITTLPLVSASENGAPVSRVRVKAGAGPIVGRRSPDCASASPGASSTDAKRRMQDRRSRPAASTSGFQLFLQLVEHAPVGAAGEDLVGHLVDQAGFAQAQCIEAQAVRRIVVAP